MASILRSMITGWLQVPASGARVSQRASLWPETSHMQVIAFAEMWSKALGEMNLISRWLTLSAHYCTSVYGMEQVKKEPPKTLWKTPHTINHCLKKKCKKPNILLRDILSFSVSVCHWSKFLKACLANCNSFPYCCTVVFRMLICLHNDMTSSGCLPRSLHWLQWCIDLNLQLLSNRKSFVGFPTVCYACMSIEPGNETHTQCFGWFSPRLATNVASAQCMEAYIVIPMSSYCRYSRWSMSIHKCSILLYIKQIYRCIDIQM